MNKRIDICISTRDRHSEIALLLQSLRTQTLQSFDLIIIDDSQTPIHQNHFIMRILTQMNLEDHNITIERCKTSGVCQSRNQAARLATNPLVCRVDDDCILEPDYLERLRNQLNDEIWLSSGVTPPIGAVPFKRSPKFVKPIINKLTFDKEGGVVGFGDDCGMQYLSDAKYTVGDVKATIALTEPLPAHHLRSCFMYDRRLHTEHNIWYELGLTNVGFREETFFCIRAILAGKKMTVDLNAKAWHLQTPSGGCRYPKYNELVAHDNYRFNLWMKRMFQEHGNFLGRYEEKWQK